MMIDGNKLRADLGALAHECRALKNVLRTTWIRPMADEQRRLTRLKRKVTELCVLRAWSRKRLHVKTVPNIPDADADALASWHEAIAQRVAKDYPPAHVDAGDAGGAR
jgi:hypothetical protein